MGFLPPIRQIVRALPRKRQTLMFSASLSREIEKLTHEFQQSPKIVEIGRRANPADTVTQLVYEVRSHLKPALLLHLLADPQFDTVLVFTRTKHGADRIARRLESSGIKTGTIHSNRSQNQRLRALKDFKSGAVRVLVATDIAARGIDVDGISHVVNYDFPMHSEDYVHRIGRTGRAHAIGDAISFITAEDHGPLRSLERFIGRGIVRKRAEGFDYDAAAPPREERGRGERRLSNRRSSRNCRAILRAVAVRLGATDSDAVRLPRHAVRGADRARVRVRAGAVPRIRQNAFSRPTKFGGGGTWIGVALRGGGPDDFRRDFRIGSVAPTCLEGFLHAPVFTGMEGQDRNASAGIEACGQVAQKSVESGKFVIHRDPQRLKNAAN